MYSISIKNIENTYDYEELIKIFLKPNEYELVENGDLIFNNTCLIDKNEIKREIYGILSNLTSYNPPWGILTGVRPLKLAGEIYDKCNDFDKTKEILLNEYMLTNEKADLLIDTLKYQRKELGLPKKNSVSVYVGIPFCPTRCSYCSFTSNQKPDSEIRRYLDSLYKEIEYVGKSIKEHNLEVESIYIGGGTPTTLNEEELLTLLKTIYNNIDVSSCKEFTVEAGRPDTITKEKLEIIKSFGIERISINPQSMKDETLKLIGRNHTSTEILNAFKLANEVGIRIVNCDLIMGLPKEDTLDFKNTLDTMLSLNPMNITVHTLAVKRASKLIEEDKEYSYKEAEIVKEMLSYGNNKLKDNGYVPYYLYRQKNMAGSFENVGWCKNNTLSIYNIRIMEEKQHILALGAGGISKIYFDNENRLERIPNVSNYEVYIDRLDEMIKRKKDNFFDKLI